MMMGGGDGDKENGDGGVGGKDKGGGGGSNGVAGCLQGGHRVGGRSGGRGRQWLPKERMAEEARAAEAPPPVLLGWRSAWPLVRPFI